MGRTSLLATALRYTRVSTPTHVRSCGYFLAVAAVRKFAYFDNISMAKKLGYCPSFLRTDKGRETPMMADAHYYFYHTACFYDTTIPDDVFDQICFADCYIYGTSTHNVKIESLWG